MIRIIKYYADGDPVAGAVPVADGAVGDPKPPSAPKGYAVTTPQQRTEWNGFLDYLDKQGVAGKAELDQQGAGLKYFQQYKKDNPNVSLSPDQIQNVQYEQYQLRKGDQFGALNKMQLDHLRSGLGQDYLNRPLSDVNGQINSSTSKLYYPQGQAYGTDVEHYDDHLGKPVGPGPIPLPDYNDPKSRETYLRQFAPKYGSFVHGRGDYILNVNRVPQYGTMTFGKSAEQEAKRLGLDPAILYSSAQEEGASGLVPDEKGLIATADEQDPKYPVDGYANYGLDNFHSNFKEMVKRGYLPKDFDYKPAPATNEQGQKVVSGVFKNTEDAMRAKAAYVKLEQDNLEDWTKKNGVNLSPTAKQFFTLIAFNGGPGRAHVLINHYKDRGLLEGDKFLQNAPAKTADPGGAWGHVIPRMQMADLLRKENLIQ